MVFDPNDHMMQIKSSKGSSDYLPVQFRLVWFRELCPGGTIDTEEIVVDLDREVTVEVYAWNQETRRSEKVLKTARGYARFKAVVTDGKGGRATGTGSECAADFSEFIEKAETKAVGRALAMLGYGTAFAPELNEEHRIVDAPVERTSNKDNARQPLASVKPSVHATHSSGSQDLDDAPASPQQLSSIQKLCEHLDKPAPTEELTYLKAKELITQLSAEYNEKRQQPSQPTNSANAPTARQLRKRCADLFGRDRFDDVKVKLFKANIPDDNLTPEQCGEIKTYLDEVLNKGAA